MASTCLLSLHQPIEIDPDVDWNLYPDLRDLIQVYLPVENSKPFENVSETPQNEESYLCNIWNNANWEINDDFDNFGFSGDLFDGLESAPYPLIDSPMSVSSSTSASSLSTSVESKPKARNSKSKSTKSKREIITRRRRGPQNRRKPNITHELYRVLCSGKSDILKWENYDEGVFKVVDKKKLAALWGEKKGNENMNYNNIA